MKRREFVKGALAGVVAFPAIGRWAAAAGPSGEIRVAVVGLGGLDVVGGVGGRGRQLIARLKLVPGVRIATLCDVDRAVLDHEVRQFQQPVKAETDLRKVFDDRSIDAVLLATPNHWHALGTIWACQAGKDVYVEKPFSYNIWEGRQMVAAARKFGRIVAVGTQRRSSSTLREAIAYLRSGQLGPIRAAHALVYRARKGIGKLEGPADVPPTVDYDLWCGPAPRDPLARKQLHYDWHWIWSTGNGEIGNNGAHMIDVCRWALGQDRPPPRVASIGGRFGFDDDGQTPNTQVALLDYQPAPLICEIRNVRAGKNSLGKFRASDRGVVIVCEGGTLAGDAAGVTVSDNQGRKIKEFPGGGKSSQMETVHVANFIEAVRSRRADQLHADARVGHVSAACCHMANVSHRLGRLASPESILAALDAKPVLAEAFRRCREYLAANQIDLARTQATAGPLLEFDAENEQFTGPLAEQANALCRRPYRSPFVVPQIA